MEKGSGKPKVLLMWSLTLTHTLSALWYRKCKSTKNK